MIWGIDYLGGANYQSVLVAGHPSGFAAGFILNTNRPYWPIYDAWPAIIALADTGLCPWIRVHALFTDNHQFRHEYIQLFDTEYQRALWFAAAYPLIKTEFSWLCENNMTADQNKQMLKRYSDPSITPVNSIFNGAVIPGCKTEVHGPSNPPKELPFNYSYDGTDAFQDNIVKTHKKFKDADVLFLWSYRCNGKYAAKDTTPRNERKAWLTADVLKSLVAMSNDPGVPTNPQDPSLPTQHLYKAVAEDSGTGDTRANKALIITPIHAKKVEFVCDGGEVVATAEYYSPFVDGRWRYYSSMCGWQIADAAFAVQGHTLVHLRISGRKIGRVCPTHRASVFN